MNQLSLSRSASANSSSPTEHSPEDSRFLGFTINDDFNALIPLVDLQATIKIAFDDILPVPQMKESLLGIINYAGKATWVIDLAHLFGGAHYRSVQTPAPTSGMGLLFQIQQETVAILVQKVSTIETYNPDLCLPIGDAMFPDRMKSFLSGYFMDDRQQSWVVVDLRRAIEGIRE
jgi:positive phototaxis protein PixI